MPVLWRLLIRLYEVSASTVAQVVRSHSGPQFTPHGQIVSVSYARVLSIANTTPDKCMAIVLVPQYALQDHRTGAALS